MTAAHEPGSIPEFENYDRAAKAISVAGLSRGEIAEYLGVRPETLSRYLSGKSAMPVAVMRLIALRTGVPFAWLQNGDNPPNSGPEHDGALTPEYVSAAGQRVVPLRALAAA